MARGDSLRRVGAAANLPSRSIAVAVRVGLIHINAAHGGRYLLAGTDQCPHSGAGGRHGKVLAAVGLAGVMAFGAGQAQARQFRSADVQPPDYPTVKAVQYMGEQLSKATDGKYTIKVFANSELGSGQDTIEQVKLGALDFLGVSSGMLNTYCPEMMVPVMLYVFRDKAHMRAVLDGPRCRLAKCSPA